MAEVERNLPYGTVDEGYAERLGSTPPPDDGPVWMVPVLRSPTATR